MHMRERRITRNLERLGGARELEMDYRLMQRIKILGVASVKVNNLHGYGHLEEIMVRRADQQLYTFKEGDFVDLHLNDIEDMLLLAAQHKLFKLNKSDIFYLVVTLLLAPSQSALFLTSHFSPFFIPKDFYTNLVDIPG
uniref:Uncharacterized protein n=1 Tax=Tanacetum cinerariifolium TaxID=118510 RepID=A0A699I005_TANCI|nr:hypothetical protein [Tanacetum cinerariifolium]